MIPTFLRPEVFPYASVEVVREPRLICAWCTLQMRDGVLPASHGLCLPCKARLEREGA
jgi:hypothetical protein